MNITISENLKNLRQKKGSTQEDLAAYLDISFQAISKWERGGAYPDITLLPKIAAYYNVSVDDLLGVGKLKQREKIEEYCVRANNEDALKVWREAIQEFPNDLSVILSLARALPDHNEKDLREQISLAERLINESTQSENYYYSATQILCYAYMELGDIEMAKKYANDMPNYFITQNQLMLSLLEGEEAVILIQNNIALLTTILAINAINMMSKGDFSPTEKIHISEDMLKVFEIIYSGNEGYSYHWTYDLYSKIAENYAKLSDLENTIKNIEASAAQVVKWTTFPNLKKYSSLFLNRHGYDNPKQDSTVKWLLNFMLKETFDFCREDKRFKAIQLKLQG